MNKRIRKKRLYKYFHPFHILSNYLLTYVHYGRTRKAKELAIKIGNRYVPGYINTCYCAANLTALVEDVKPNAEGVNEVRQQLWRIWYHQDVWYHNRIFGVKEPE